MALIPGDDERRFRSQGALQKHFVVRIRGCASGPFHWKNHVSRRGEGLDPRNPRFSRVARRQFLDGIAVFGQELRADEGPAVAPSPGGQAIEGLTPPKARAGDHVGVEDYFHLKLGN